jgi:soluble lytic murein transglycosylase
MLNRLISLVLLLLFANTYTLYGNENLILPKNKPSVFKKINKKSIQKKQIDSQKKISRDNITLPESKPSQKTEKKEVLKNPTDPNKTQPIDIKETVKIIKQTNFILPQKKPASYKKKVNNNLLQSRILNKKDFEKAKDIFKLIKEGRWNSALKASKNVKDREFRDLVNWMYLKTTGNKATFSDYQKFIEKNHDYPRISRLRYLAEHKVYLKNNSPTAIINWFEKYPPVSGMGKIKLSEALLEQGRTDEITSLIKEGWVEAKISKNDLGYYRAKFKKFINTDDHINRAKRLAWDSKYWDLKRMLRYLPKDEKALYNARQILMSNSYGVDNAIAKVPNHLKNEIGLQYDRLKWRNRRGRLEPSLEILYDNSNKTEEQLVRADLWWKQRESLVRSLVYKKKYKTAYKVASEHSLTSGANFAEAEWLAGWIAHAFLNSQEYAINHFLNFYNNVSYPISLARGAYWLGKSYQAINDTEKTEKYFKEGAAFLTTYYGQLSFEELNRGNKFELIEQAQYSKEYEKEFNKNRLIKHVILLNELNHTKYTKDILKHLASLNINEGSEVLAADLATKIERYDFAIQISKKASYEKRFYLKYNYPIITTPREINNKTMPQPELVLAIIRQESEFDRRANSYVGARGMMQLMKYTAKIVAKQAKLPYSISGLTNDPEYNIKLGSYYFNSLLEDYNGVYPFAIAAYNAGPNRVKTWRRINGDPTKNQISYINWIELIRFKETRNYVQRVLENINVYKYMLRKEPVKIEGFFK